MLVLFIVPIVGSDAERIVYEACFSQRVPAKRPATPPREARERSPRSWRWPSTPARCAPTSCGWRPAPRSIISSRRTTTATWSVLPLRAAAGARHAIATIYSDPSASDFADTPLVERCPYLQQVLAAFECPLHAVRLMKLSPGSLIKPHRDHRPGCRVREGAPPHPCGDKPSCRVLAERRARGAAGGRVLLAGFEPGAFRRQSRRGRSHSPRRRRVMNRWLEERLAEAEGSERSVTATPLRGRRPRTVRSKTSVARCEPFNQLFAQQTPWRVARLPEPGLPRPRSLPRLAVRVDAPGADGGGAAGHDCLSERRRWGPARAPDEARVDGCGRSSALAGARGSGTVVKLDAWHVQIGARPGLSGVLRFFTATRCRDRVAAADAGPPHASRHAGPGGIRPRCGARPTGSTQARVLAATDAAAVRGRRAGGVALMNYARAARRARPRRCSSGAGSAGAEAARERVAARGAVRRQDAVAHLRRRRQSGAAAATARARRHRRALGRATVRTAEASTIRAGSVWRAILRSRSRDAYESCGSSATLRHPCSGDLAVAPLDARR